MSALLIWLKTAGGGRSVWIRNITAVLLFGTAIGCASSSVKRVTDPIVGPSHALKNVYRQEGVLPGSLRRVAVLPLSYNETTGAGASAREIFEPVYHAELAKAARFEPYLVKPAQLAQWTGRERWDDFDELPAHFLTTIAERTGCDGILFARTAHFKAYPPMLIGWRMRLVTTAGDTLWAADEVFDAAEEAVSNSARRYDRAHTKNNPVLEDSRAILLSPAKFGQYTLHTVLETLPVR